MLRRLLILLSALLLSTPPVRAATNPEWTTPLPPFRIARGLYYVGSVDLAAYLITTPAGNILINSNLTSSPPQIRHSIEQLGFRWADTKILLISHAHFDHAGGSAEILRETHAKYMVTDGDAQVVETGGAQDFTHFGSYPPAHVDRVLHDGDTVRLGNVFLTAHKTAGHTRGCTTWTYRTADGLNVVIVGSWSVLDEYRLTGAHPSYPHIADDYARSFVVYKSLPCDVFLAAHGSMFNLRAKSETLARNPHGPNPFIDPAAYQAAVAEHERDFYTALKKQQLSAKP